MSMPPPFPDPELEGKYAGRPTLMERAGTFILSTIAVVLVLGGAAVLVALIR
jgi:hypothetical protein